MSSRFLQLQISGYEEIHHEALKSFSGLILRGLTPQVSQIRSVTPGMLKAILLTGYFN